MGGLVRILPRTYAMIFIGSLALMGFPFLTGFYSKDVILEVAYGSYAHHGHVAHWLGTMAAFCTAWYSIRLLYLTFLAQPSGYRLVRESSHDAPLRMAIPLIVLCFGSIFVGWRTKDRMIGLGTPFWSNALFTHPDQRAQLDAEFIPHEIKRVPVFFSRSGGGLAIRFYSQSRRSASLFGRKQYGVGQGRYVFLNRKWFFDKVYNETVTQVVRHHAYHSTYKRVDRGRIERIGPFGRSQRLNLQSMNRIRIHNGHVLRGLMMILLGWLIALCLCMVPVSMNLSMTMPDTRLFFVMIGLYLFI